MFCTKCGSQVADDANFCAKCAAPVRRPDNAGVGGQNQFKPNPAPAFNGVGYTRNAYGNNGNIRRNDVAEEFKKFFVACIIPIVYFVFVILRDIIINTFYGDILYVLVPIASFLLYGMMLGGMVVAVNNCGRYMRWFYIIPYALLCIKWALPFRHFYNIIYCVFYLAEVFVVLGISIAMQRVKTVGNTRVNNVVIAVISGAAVVVFQYIYSLILDTMIRGYEFYFDRWDLYTIIFTIGGAALGAVINTAIVKSKTKRI